MSRLSRDKALRLSAVNPNVNEESRGPTMKPTDVYVLVFDGFADWEPAHVLAELRREGRRRIVVVGFERKPVTSMGGLCVTPDHALSEVEVDEIGLLVLPGGDIWEQGGYPQPLLEGLLHTLVARSVPIAAICGATLALARARLLNDRRHTSSVPGDLNAAAPAYSGSAHYVPELAVTDRGVITASGLGSVDFAREVFATVRLFNEADEALWFDMYKHGRLPNATV